MGLAAGVYAEQLLSKAHGLPMWIPEPSKFGEVLIGDVGYVFNGSFYRLFNVTYPKDHPVNQDGVPDGFHVLEFDPRLLHRVDQYLDAGAICSKSVKRVDVAASGSSNTLNAGIGYSFSCAQDQGALLILKAPATQEIVHPNRAFRDYMRAHHDKWYDFAHARGLDIEPDHIILVRGWVKTTEWAVAAFTDSGSNHEIKFDAPAGPFAKASFSVSYSSAVSMSVEHRTGPSKVLKEFQSYGTETDDVGNRQNQCVFLSYYELRARSFWGKKKIHAAAEPRDYGGAPPESDKAVESDSDRDSDDSWDIGEDRPPPKFVDPVGPLLNYILENSDAEVAIASDEDIRRLMPDDSELWLNDVAAYLRENQPRIAVDDTCAGYLVHEEPQTSGTHAGQLHPQGGDDATSIMLGTHVRSPFPAQDAAQHDHGAMPPAVYHSTKQDSRTITPAMSNLVYDLSGDASSPRYTSLLLDPTVSSRTSAFDLRSFGRASCSIPSSHDHESVASAAIEKKSQRPDAEQLSVLNEAYNRTAFPSQEERQELARKLEMSGRSVQIWFQSKRKDMRQISRQASSIGAKCNEPSTACPPSSFVSGSYNLRPVGSIDRDVCTSSVLQEQTATDEGQDSGYVAQNEHIGSPLAVDGTAMSTSDVRNVENMSSFPFDLPSLDRGKDTSEPESPIESPQLDAVVMPTPLGKGGDPPREGEDSTQEPMSLPEQLPSPATTPSQPPRVRVRGSMYIPGWAVPPKVLVVDDDAVCRKLSSKFLRIFGCFIDIAVDGLGAVSKMNLAKYDLVFMDIVMPNLDGVSATSLIRQFDDLTPIISMTSNSQPNEVTKYFLSGMNDILPKPFTKDDLLRKLEKHLIHLKAEELRRLSRSPNSVTSPLIGNSDQVGVNGEVLSTASDLGKRLREGVSDREAKRSKIEATVP